MCYVALMGGVLLKPGKPNNKPELPMKKPSIQARFIIEATLFLGATLAALVQQGFVVAAQPANTASGGAVAQSKPGAAAPTIRRSSLESGRLQAKEKSLAARHKAGRVSEPRRH
jgi:hypothetical protein